MLAEWIGSDFAPIRPSRKFHRQPGNVEFADRLVLDPPDRPALTQMRMRHSLMQGENRRAWHPLRFQGSNGRIAAWKTTEPSLDDLFERCVVVSPRPRRVEAGIIRQLRHVHRFDHLLPLIR